MSSSIGTTVLYVLTQSDADQINRRRTTGEAIKNRLGQNPPQWPEGAQAHVGDAVKAGDMLPMLVTRETAAGSMISGQVFLNGNDTFWVPACELVEDELPTPGQAAGLANADWNALKADLRHPTPPTAASGRMKSDGGR